MHLDVLQSKLVLLQLREFQFQVLGVKAFFLLHQVKTLMEQA